MNPIEHLWDEQKGHVQAYHPVPQTLPELKVAVEEEWRTYHSTS